MRKLKHLPLGQWRDTDREAFRAAYEPGDVFDETGGPGSHLAEGTRRMIQTAYRRWLGFLREFYPDDLLKAPADRITLERVRAFVDHLSRGVRPTTVAHVIDNLCYAARLIAPKSDWRWLGSIKSRLVAQAHPEDRFERLVPPWQILDFGIELMDEARKQPSNGHRPREIQYRDGLILVLLALWHIRRRSITALTVSRHLEFDAAGVNILLYPEDTKAKRAESLRVPEELLPYLVHYLKQIRPRLLGHSQHDGLWASFKGRPLTGGGIYDMVRSRITARFGKAMGLHDFRRAGPTFLAIDAPEKIGLMPGMLQHASDEVGQRYYNLARSMEASRRFAGHLARARNELRLTRLGTRDDPCAP
jgi:integrase/recombinase XerD